jgi:hypothetical protein
MANIITYGYFDKRMTAIYCNGVQVITIITPSNGWTSSWQENELSLVEETAKKLYGDNFILAYYVGQDGYVYKSNNCPVS